ncbi:MAG: 2-dehydropantoate 2-reductase [Aquabacterium sp.]|nr:2-dehydropantoate 2-reductase [Aquabacterium sp.]
MIVGAGSVGSTLGLYLSKAGHEVGIFARGNRLAALTLTSSLRVKNMLTGRQSEAAVTPLSAINPDVIWDLMIVSVQGQQLDALLPMIAASNSQYILFMLNTVTDVAPLRQAVGRDRFMLGLPAILADIKNQQLEYMVMPRYLAWMQITTVGAMPDYTPAGLDEIRHMFQSSGIATAICADMPAWLKTHAAFMAPIMAAGLLTGTDNNLPWSKAKLIASAMKEGFSTLKRIQSNIEPWNMRFVQHVPYFLLTIFVWASFRTRMVRAATNAHVGHAKDEVAYLIEALCALDTTGGLNKLPALNTLVSQTNNNVSIC